MPSGRPGVWSEKAGEDARAPRWRLLREGPTDWRRARTFRDLDFGHWPLATGRWQLVIPA